MGNKQKNSNNKIIHQNSIYLLCPNCFKKIPIFNTFIEGENIKIKISCSCLENNTYLIMNLIEYLSEINNFLNTNLCMNHEDEKTLSTKFCINCESWLCLECYTQHSIEICEKEYYNKNNDNGINDFCDKHNEKKIYLCNKCLIIFCKQCFLQHNIRNINKHKGSNIECYLTEQKIKSKYNKYQLYSNNITELNTAIKDELLKDIYNLKENKENLNKNFLINFQENYLIHKSIDEQYKILFDLILKNCEYINNYFILNKKFLYNVIINTKINKAYPKLDKNIPIIEQIKYFSNFMKVNYINKKQEYNLNLISKIEKSNSIIEKMLSLPGNKFVAITKDCEILIYEKKSDKNKSFEKIFSFNEHCNNITCIILLRNKKFFATASDDRTVKIWDIEKGKSIKTISIEGKPFLIYEKYGRENEIGCLPDRNSISVYKYDEKTQNILFSKSLEKTISWIEGLYQFPNDGRIIISSYGKFEVFSNDYNESKIIYIANRIPQNFLQIKNEDLIVGLSSNEFFVYDKNLNFKRKLLGHKKNITSFVQLDDNKLLTASLDSNIILWEIDNYEIIFNFINNSLSVNTMILINEYRIITGTFNKINIIEEWEIVKNEYSNK